MRGLGITEAEAKEVHEYDLLVEKSRDSTRLKFDLSPEKQAIARKYTRTGTREVKQIDGLNLAKRERKPDTTKEGLITLIAGYLAENGMENVTIKNPSREITLDLGGENFSLTLTRHTKKK